MILGDLKTGMTVLTRNGLDLLVVTGFQYFKESKETPFEIDALITRDCTVMNRLVNYNYNMTIDVNESMDIMKVFVPMHESNPFVHRRLVWDRQMEVKPKGKPEDLGQANDWQPIETAPTDGKILLYDPIGKSINLVDCTKTGFSSCNGGEWRREITRYDINKNHMWHKLPCYPENGYKAYYESGKE